MSGGLSASPCPGSGSRSPRCAGAARRPHVRHPPCAGAARRSRPVSTLPRAAAPGGPAGVVGVGPHGPFPARLAAAPAGGRDSAAGSPADFRSHPGIHPLSVQPRAQVSSLRKAAVPRAIEQMGRSRARMGGPQPGSPAGRTGAPRRTNQLRPTAIRRSDGFPAPALRAGRHGIPSTGVYCGRRDRPAALPGTGRPDSAALESHGAVQSDQ